MGSEAIQTQDLVINYVDDDVSKGALWMDSMGDGGAWKNGTEERSSWKSENKELGVLSKERERENNKRFFGNPEKA